MVRCSALVGLFAIAIVGVVGAFDCFYIGGPEKIFAGIIAVLLVYFAVVFALKIWLEELLRNFRMAATVIDIGDYDYKYRHYRESTGDEEPVEGFPSVRS